MKTRDDGTVIDDELASMYDEQEPTLTPEDVFDMTMVNKIEKVRTKVSLVDNTGDSISIAEVSEKIVEYISKQYDQTNGSNTFLDQILPLMGQLTASILGRSIGLRHAMFYMSEPDTRDAMIHIMASGFLLLKFLQKNNISIETSKESVTDEEIEDIEKKSHLSSVMTLAGLAGANVKEVLKALKDKGLVTDEDIAGLLEDDEDENKE